MKMDRQPNSNEKADGTKSQEVNLNKTLAPALEDGDEVARLFFEPKIDQISINSVLCLGKENTGMETANVGGFHEQNSNLNFGCLDSSTTQEGGVDLSFGKLDGMLDGIAEVDDIHASDDLSTICKDFLRDFEYPEEIIVPDLSSDEGLVLPNSASDYHSPGSGGSNNGPNGGIGTFESEGLRLATSTPDIHSPYLGGSNNGGTRTSEYDHNFIGSINEKATCELVNNFTGNAVSEIPSQDEKTPHPFDVHKHDEMCSDDDNVILSSVMSRGKKIAVNSNQGDKVKRLRKPTKRFMDEFVEQKSKSLVKTRKSSIATSADKNLKAESDGEHSDQAPSLSSTDERHLEKFAPTSGEESSENYSPLESDDEDEDEPAPRKKHKVGRERRKHQRMWSLPEVISLIEGVSHFGVGKWTDIGKKFFPTTSFRTAMDLRDKWRNLVNACTPRKRNKIGPKNATRTLPKNVINRIRELSNIYPYPRPNSSISSHASVASAKSPNETGGAPSRPCEINLRGKKQT